MRFRDYTQQVFADLYRIDGKMTWRGFLKELAYGEGYAYCFWLRSCSYLRGRLLTRFTLYPIASFALRHYKYKLGISIPIKTEIGQGLYIGHFGGIVVNGEARIGKNCNLSHGVTIGRSNRGVHSGYPVIGDNVFIGPGAMIFGAVHIGNDAAIGANSVVIDDVPDNAVAVGSPARIVSYAGSAKYVNRTNYSFRQEFKGEENTMITRIL